MPEQDSISPESPLETQLVTSPDQPPQPDPPLLPAEPTKETMIDIHDAHNAASTWRDFFIHIATIVLGLCIAVGMEQAVEAVHHAHERRQLIADMREEAARNVVILHTTIDRQLDQTTWVLAAMKTLQQATPRAGVATVTLPPHEAFAPATIGDRAVWSIAQANGKAALLTEQEAELYYRLDFEAGAAWDAGQRLASVTTDEHSETARLHVHFLPAATVTVPVAELPDLLKVEAAKVGAIDMWVQREAYWAGAAEAVANGEQREALFDAMRREYGAIKLRIQN